MVLISSTPDVANEFTPQAYTLHDFFTSEARGFYIPLYQRPYSWNTENVDQLMEDILKGVENTLMDAQSVSFLGTVILCLEQNKKKNIEPVDIRALPGTVYNVIDGQQRISTLALLATRLFRATRLLTNKLSEKEVYAGIVDYLDGVLEDLTQFFSLALKTREADPKLKPVAIRGSHDEWTLNGLDEKYTSPVSNYLARFIRASNKQGIDIPDKRTSLGRNLKAMDSYIELVMSAHKQTETHLNYPDAKKILRHIDQDLIWGYEREDLFNIVFEREYSDEECDNVSKSVQLCMLFHYFFDRACLSVIYPSSEDWAFDIFQSLNATGTPLTAIETFKPLVVNTVNREPNKKYKGSLSEEYFSLVDDLFSENDTAEKKAKLTKEFLNIFRLCYEGKSLSNHFSHQRKWLNDTYSEFSNLTEREEFVHRLSNLAKYWFNVKWFEDSSMTSFYGLTELKSSEKELSVLCVRYLDDASHRMSDTLLSRFYSQVIRKTNGAAEEFVESAKAIAAFFTLWRAAYSNTGLDDVYRKLLEQQDESSIPNFSWSGAGDLDIGSLKRYLLGVLKEKGIDEKQAWLERASRNLRYDTAKTVCKFALLVSSHDTISDPSTPGLMKKGSPGVNPLMNVGMWGSADLKTIEHVAPQSNDEAGWDTDIYSKQLEHAVGNLTLLPININSSIGNRSWEEKVIYYKHLALTDPDKARQLHEEAKSLEIELKEETLTHLQEATYAAHIQPLVEFAESSGVWDSNFIEARSYRICEVVWDSLYRWLS